MILTSRKFLTGIPPPSYGVEKRRDHRNCVGGRQIVTIPKLGLRRKATVRARAMAKVRARAEARVEQEQRLE